MTDIRLGFHWLEVDERLGNAQPPELLSVSQSRGVVPRSSLTDRPASAKDLSKYKICQPGDLVLNRFNAYRGSLGVSSLRGVVSPDYLVLRPRGNAEPQYLEYLLKSQPLRDAMTMSMGGIGGGDPDSSGFARIDVRTLHRTKVSQRTIEAQCAIADFLDRETALIDELIEKQTTFIERLRERRAEVIAHAVTCGIRGETLIAVKSDWVGRLPASWSVGRIHYDFGVVLGKMLDAGKQVPDAAVLLPYIRAANIQPNGLTLNDVNEMPFSPYEASRLDLRRGDLLVVEGGSVGVSYVLKNAMPGWSFQKTVNRVRSRGGASTRFLHYVLNFYLQRGVFGIVCSGSTIAHLTSEKLRAMDWPKPPAAEQRAIADHLDRETAKIDGLISKVERHIELAKERRSALITAAVTGQIDIGAV